MLWLIQKGFYRKNNHEKLIEVLGKGSISFQVFCLEDLLSGKVDVGKEEEIIVSGGMRASKYALEKGWKPGSFMNGNFSYFKWGLHYKNNMLNSDIQVGKIGEIEPKLDEFFARPVEDSKYFAGTVMTKSFFEREKNNAYFKKISDKEIIITGVKKIYAEYRFFVVDGNIISHSQYKSGDAAYITSVVPTDSINFVKDMCVIWEPSRAFVVDIALTEEGYKIVEFNNYLSSGFYACDVSKIVEAVLFLKQ